MRSAFVALVFVIAAAGGARADWLSNAWSDGSVAARGNPSITLHPDGITVTLPSATLKEAHAEGLSTKDALTAFLERFGPQCSAVLDLNAPRKDLKVELSLQNEVPFDDLAAATQEEIVGGLNGEMKRRTEESQADENKAGGDKAGVRPLPPRLQRVFAVSPEHIEFSIDFQPPKKAHCIEFPVETS